MNQNLKNFIMEGEKEFEEKFPSARNGDYTEHPRPELLAWHSSRQISLIKMIVDEYSQIPSYSCNTYSNEGDRILPLMVQKADVDTISSKLKNLIKE